MLKIDNLHIGYRISQKKIKYLQKNICLDAPNSELIAIVGENGIGKSTFLRTIANLQHILSGKILINETDISKLSRNEIAKKISYVSTDIISFAKIDVFTLISQGRFPYTNWFGKLNTIDTEIVEDAIKLLNLERHKNKYINEISDGERQRVLIARALVQDTDIIILDEPTAFLDLSNKYQITSILKDLTRKKNKTIIFSSHDFNIVLKEADKIWLFNNKNIISGAPEDLIINNSFNTLFNNSDLEFSIEKGDFISKTSATKEIAIIGEGNHKTLTKRALERMSFKVIKNNSSDLILKVDTANNSPFWQLNYNKHKPKTFDSIYSLSIFLRNLV